MSAELIFFPFMAAGFLLAIVIGVLFFVFWVWMIVDCAQRKFNSDGERIAWILVVILASWIGSLIYYFVIKMNDKKGISSASSKGKSRNRL
ncbi:hypothetical protein COU54_00210 [Candidatus Pacearchaeota archaeon CG10_big_fil_rev_8_21_14_0_10_31_24]|nr:MAG: hypothetical protein COU54_00210 [Candidatus Pacearchaeota archaeon CG10_big_fil_rev_8_21_14_0_10_31_24]